MQYTVYVNETAVPELEDAYGWLVALNPAHAPKWYNAILDAIDSLDSMPARYPLVHDREAFDESARQLAVGDKRHCYLIIFEIRGERVVVLHIRNAAREDRNADDQ